MSFFLGLTGSIGMGKSTTAEMFANHGCAIWNADTAVHRLYSVGGAAVEPIGAAFPRALKNHAIDRDILREIITADPAALSVVERIVHPLVIADSAQFKKDAAADVLVFDVPLLFETRTNEGLDAVACVFVEPDEQRRRVLGRGTMTEEQFEHILSKQIPIEEKLARSDYRIETDTLEHAEAQVAQILREIREGMTHA